MSLENNLSYILDIPFDTTEARQYIDNLGNIRSQNAMRSKLNTHYNDISQLMIFDNVINGGQDPGDLNYAGFRVRYKTTGHFNHNQHTIEHDLQNLRNVWDSDMRNIIYTGDTQRAQICIMIANKIDSKCRQAYLDWLNDPSNNYTYHKAATISMLSDARDKSLVVTNGDKRIILITEELTREQELKFHATAALMITATYEFKDKLKFLPFYVEVMQGADMTAPERLLRPHVTGLMEQIQAQRMQKAMRCLLEFDQVTAQNLKDAIANRKIDVQDAITRYNSRLQRLTEAENRLTLFQCGQLDSKMQELVDYISKNKPNSLHNVEVEGRVIWLTISGPMHLELEVLKRFDGRGNSFDHTSRGIKEFLMKVAKGDLILPTIGKIKLNTETNGVSASSMNGTTHNGCAVNIHWSGFQCIGNLRDPVVECLRSDNWIPLYELLCTAVGQINATDGSVFPDFISHLENGLYDSVSVTHKTTGQVKTIRQWINDEEVPF